MLKPNTAPYRGANASQPPSGGCVLKQSAVKYAVVMQNQPPSGGCVLKPLTRKRMSKTTKPAAFRRLCVETKNTGICCYQARPSRLQAAVC